jgi:hypothetical protein
LLIVTWTRRVRETINNQGNSHWPFRRVEYNRIKNHS